MAYLKPSVVARAAASLFNDGKTANDFALPFFYLKAAGLRDSSGGPDNEVKVPASSEPPPALARLAGQPEGFAAQVEANIGSAAWNASSFASKPQGEASKTALYWPLCARRNRLLRKRDAQRNAVQTNLSEPQKGENEEQATFSDVYVVRRDEEGSIHVRFAQGYVRAAAWYLGPASGQSLRVPLAPLAVWLARLDAELAPETTIDQLVERAREQLHLNAEELHTLFDTSARFPLQPDDFEDTRDEAAYFRALVVDPAPVDLPALQVYDSAVELEPARYQLTASLYGFGEGQAASAKVVAESLVADDQRNILLYGPPRTGKSRLALELAAKYLEIPVADAATDPRVARVQFHPGWTYGDFIRKLAPTSEAGALRFVRVRGALLAHCREYAAAKSVFIIDEINRASVPTVFGEAFQVMEMGRRGESVALPGTMPGGDDDLSLTIPKDLLLIATANNLDRSTSELDFALLERFGVVDCGVDYGEALRVLQEARGWPDQTARRFLLEVIFEVQQKSDFPIGHAHFYSMPADPAAAERWYRTNVRPSLRAYLTRFREDELEGIDALFRSWRP